MGGLGLRSWHLPGVECGVAPRLLSDGYVEKKAQGDYLDAGQRKEEDALRFDKKLGFFSVSDKT
ncbi:hypothetical protein D3C84_676860 [compost metagenome]